MNIQTLSIGARVQIAMDKRSIKASQLASAVGVSRAAVSGWLKGEHLSVNHLVAIADYLSVSLNWLILDMGSMSIAADAQLTALEEDLIKITRYFGDDTLKSALDMMRSLTRTRLNGVKAIKAYDLVSRAGMPIAVLDKHGHLVFSNIYHNRLLGLDDNGAHNMVGKHFTQWIPKIFHRKFRTLIEEALKSGFSEPSRIEVVCPFTRQPRQLIAHSRAIRTTKGTGVQLIFRPLDHVD